MPTSWWAGPGPSVNKLEKVFQNVAYQHKCPCVRMNSEKLLPPTSVSPVQAPIAPTSFLGALQDQPGGLTQAPFKLLLPLVSEHVRFCVCSLRVQSVSHVPVALQKVIPFQSLIFLVQEPWAREFNMGLRPFSP